MKTKLAILVAVALGCIVSNRADACGYGIFDSDVELACSGDPLQSKAAMDRIMKRGRSALRAVNFYHRNAVLSRNHNVNYLKRLQIADPQLKLTPQQRETEIKRVLAGLEFSRKQLRQLDLILYKLGGRSFAGAPWRVLLDPKNAPHNV